MEEGREWWERVEEGQSLKVYNLFSASAVSNGFMTRSDTVNLKYSAFEKYPSRGCREVLEEPFQNTYYQMEGLGTI